MWGSVLVSLLLMSAACSDAVQMVREAEHGGTITYSYRADRGGHLGSPYRAKAFDSIAGKCGNRASRVVREGEARGYSNAGMGVLEGTEDESRGRRWGIQFECIDKRDAGVRP